MRLSSLKNKNNPKKSEQSNTSRLGTFNSSQVRVQLSHVPMERTSSRIYEKTIFVLCLRRLVLSTDWMFGPQSTYIKVSQCMSPRWNWDSPTPSLASECVPLPEPKGGTLASELGVGGVPIPTTGEKAQHSAYSVVRPYNSNDAG